MTASMTPGNLRTTRTPMVLPRWITALIAAFLITVASQVKSDESEWQWQAAIYGWLPDIDGQTQFPGGTTGPAISVSAEQLIDNLDFTLMGAIHAQKGDWGLLLDVIYLNEGASRTRVRDFEVGSAGRPQGVELDAALDLKSWVLTLAGTYEVSEDEKHAVSFLAGARWLDMEQRLDWSFSGSLGDLPLTGPIGKSEASGDTWDFIAGFRGEFQLGDGQRWYLPFYVDVGTGDADFTWQAMAGLGYRFDWGGLFVNWRHLEYELGSDSAFSDLQFSGPLVGALFQW